MHDSTVIKGICEALEVIYSPLSRNDQRKDAQQFLESLKEDSACPIYGHHLAHCKSKEQPYSDTVRFFGLGLIEHAIRFKWAASYNDQERQHIKESLVDLVTNGLSGAPEGERLFIKEKVALIFAELAEREWPQRWQNLDSLLVQMASSNSKLHLHISILFLRHLAEDVFAFPNPVTIKRKEDLRNSLIAILSHAPESFSGPFAAQAVVPVQVYSQCGLQPGNEGWISRIISVLQNSKNNDEYTTVACVEALGSFIDWIPFDLLSKGQLAQHLFLLLDSPFAPVQKAACEALVMLTGRVFSDWNQANEVILNPLLSDDALRILNSAWAKNQGAGNVESDDIDRHLAENYPFLKRLAQFWADIGLLHICHKKAEQVHPNLPKYLQIVLELTKHDSLTICSIAIHVWLSLIRMELTAKSPALLAICDQLYEILIMKLNKYPFLPSDDEDDDENVTLSGRYSKTDYDEIGEFQVAFGAFRSQAFTLIKFIASHRPLNCLQTSSKLLFSVMKHPEPVFNPKKVNKKERNANGLLTTTSQFYCLWDMAVAAIHATLVSISENLKSADINAVNQIRQLALQTFQTLLQGKESTDPIIINRQLEGLTSFTPFFGPDSGSIAFSLLQKIFAFVTFTLPNEKKIVDDNWNVSDDTKALRRKACSSLLKIVPGMGSLLHGIYQDIIREIARLVQEKLVNLSEKAYLEEFKCFIIFHIDLPTEGKFQMYSPIFEEQAVSLVSSEISSMIVSTQAFMSAIGISSIAAMIKPGQDLRRIPLQITSQILQERRQRRYVQYLITAYKNCLSRTVRTGTGVEESLRKTAIKSSPWAAHLNRILSAVLGLVRNLHALWDTNCFGAQYPKEIQKFLELTPLEKSIIMGSIHGNDENELNTSDTLAGEISNIQNFLRIFREALYGLLGQATYLVPGEEFYGVVSTLDGQPLANMILSGMFASVESLSNYHWRALIHFVVRPLILNCPENHFHDVLHHLLPPLFTFIWQKLDFDWKEMVKKGNFVGTMEEAHASEDAEEKSEEQNEEIIKQKILTDFTRVWGDLISAMFLASSENQPGKISSKSGSASVPTTPNASGKHSPDFGVHDALVRFCLQEHTIAEPMLYCMLASLTWKDTRVCSFSARALLKIVPVLAQNAVFHTFIAKEVLLAALRSLHDGYHQEGHDMILALITETYVIMRPQTDLVVETLKSVVPKFNSQEFDAKIKQELRLTMQKRMMKDCLKEIIGVKPGQWFNKPLGSSSSMARLLPEKMILQSAKEQSRLRQGTTDLDDSLDDKHGAGLLELFGNT